MVLKALLMRTEGECTVGKILRPVKVARLVEDRVRNVLCVLLERGEPARLAKCKLLLGH